MKKLSHTWVQGNTPQLPPCSNRTALCLLTQQILLTLPKQCQVSTSCLRHSLATQQSSDLLPSPPLLSLSLQWANQSQEKPGWGMEWRHLFQGVPRARLHFAMHKVIQIQKSALFTVTIYRREGLTTLKSISSFHRTAVTLSILGGKKSI